MVGAWLGAWLPHVAATSRCGRGCGNHAAAISPRQRGRHLPHRGSHGPGHGGGPLFTPVWVIYPVLVLLINVSMVCFGIGVLNKVDL